MAAADPQTQRKQTRAIALGGIAAALVLLALTAAAWSPTADLAFMTLASFCLAMAVIETGRRGAWLVYAATALVSLAWPGLALSWPYLVFFGPYPLVRALIDPRLAPRPARLVRVLSGGVLALSGILLFVGRQALAFVHQRGTWLWFVLPLAGLAVVALYDLALGLLIRFYLQRLKR
ncbi:MAG: hypothetical protein GX821_03040 [Clostridiaceae bacterium]|nr:hypothetical protein [Clostridiales bacterium]MDD4743152.1 hypothetical protein [Eubacteriales bacterium]NLB44122.1 hypothetical protein [Clostridiaceae bacterium]